MKTKVTKKSIRNSGAHVIAIGYCEAQHLFPDGMAFGYSTSSYGWDCDYYRVYVGSTEVIVSSGYRTIGTLVPREIVKKFEEKAAEVSRTLSYQEYLDAVYGLQQEFAKAALEN